MTLLVSPARKLTVPLVAPVKSAALVPTCCTAQFTLDAPTALLRVTVKVNGVVPLLPSIRLALVAAMLTVGRSSLAMVAVATLPAPSEDPRVPDRRTLKLSFSSMVLSATTLTVMVLLVSPARKLTTPLVAPLKSAAVVVPCSTVHDTSEVPSALLRLTVKVNGVVPPVPSALLAAVATMDTAGRSSFRMVPADDAVPSVAPTAPDSTTLNASSDSTTVSPSALTVTSLTISPAAKVTVPLVAPLKSAATVVPWATAQFTEAVPTSVVRVTA